MNFLIPVLGLAGLGALVYRSNQSGKPAAQQTTPLAQASGSVQIPVPQVSATQNGPVASSAPAVTSNSGGSVIDDITNFIATADDVITAAATNNDFPVSAVVATHDTGSAGDLNVRTIPSKSGDIAGKVPHGSIVQITGPHVQGDGTQPGGWAPVHDPATGVTGFASMAFLDTDPTTVQAAHTQGQGF